MKRSNVDMRTPIFFKVWFAFVGLVVLSIMAGTVYLLFSIAQAGPEGIGRQIGAIVKGIKDGADSR